MKEGFAYSNENRSESAFAVKLSGRTVYIENGRRIISDANHIAFLPKGASYKFGIEEEGECIIFNLSFLDDKLPFDKITSIPIHSPSNVHLAAQKAERSWTYKKQGYIYKCMGYIYDILSHLTDGSNPYINSEKYAIVEPSIKYLEEKLSDPDINTEMLAGISGISIPYFRKIFHEIYKMPVAKYIESIRISKACDLLKTDGISLSYIAECVGYRNIYHFSKAFKKVTGFSPSNYMRNNL